MGTVRHVIEINAPVDKVFRAWNDFSALDEYFDLVTQVSIEPDQDKVTIEYRGITGGQRSVELQVTERVTNRVLAWKVAGFRDQPMAGSFTFESSGATTFVTFVFSFDPPLARLGDILTDLFRYPQTDLVEGLNRFSNAMES